MNKEKAKKIGFGIFSLLLFEFNTYFKYIPALLLNISMQQVAKNGELVVLFSFFISLLTTFILLIIYRKELIEEWKIMKKDFFKNLDTGIACWGVGLIIMVASNLFLQNVLHSGGAKNENAIQEYIKILPFVMGLDICLIAPIYEELVFRKAIRNIFMKPYLYIPASFLIFGGVHIVYTATTLTDWLYIIPYGALGGAFAFAYYKTDSIYTSMFFHMTHNTVLFLLSVLI